MLCEVVNVLLEIAGFGRFIEASRHFLEHGHHLLELHLCDSLGARTGRCEGRFCSI